MPGFKPSPRGPAPFAKVHPLTPANLRPRLQHRPRLLSSPLQTLSDTTPALFISRCHRTNPRSSVPFSLNPCLLVPQPSFTGLRLPTVLLHPWCHCTRNSHPGPALSHRTGSAHCHWLGPAPLGRPLLRASPLPGSPAPDSNPLPLTRARARWSARPLLSCGPRCAAGPYE